MVQSPVTRWSQVKIALFITVSRVRMAQKETRLSLTVIKLEKHGIFSKSVDVIKVFIELAIFFSNLPQFNVILDTTFVLATSDKEILHLKSFIDISVQNIQFI